MIGGGVLFLGFEGARLAREERKILARVRPAGLVLFARNVGSAGELRELCAELKSLLPEVILAVDSEGGRVDRLRGVVGAAPAASQLAARRAAGSRTAGRWIGASLRHFGIDLDLAPVVDLDHGRRGNALDGRCLGREPRGVAARARAFLEGLHAAGVGGCLKHFPGLGGADLDTHRSPARVERGRRELARDLAPFGRLSGLAECALVGHAVYPALDPERRPASLSPPIASGALRRASGWARKALLSDDLEMGALSAWGDPPELAVQALEAGCDALLFCRRIETAPRIAQRLGAPRRRERLERATLRLARLRRDLGRLRERSGAPAPLELVSTGLRRLAPSPVRGS